MKSSRSLRVTLRGPRLGIGACRGGQIVLEYLLLGALIAAVTLWGFATGMGGMRSSLADLYGKFTRTLRDAPP